MLPNNAWTVNDVQLQELPIMVAVPLPSRRLNTTPTSFRPSDALAVDNTLVEMNTLKTCIGNGMGCIEISFAKAAPVHMAMLGAVSSVGGMMSAGGWAHDAYWLCKGEGAYNNVDRVCPMTTVVDMNKGVVSCGEDITSMEQLMTVLKDANSQKMWGLRLLGFILFWCSFNCCFHPIKQLMGFITNMMDAGTDCIPCVGGCVDCLTDIFMSVVSSVLCVVSFCCAAASFLSVVVFMWIVMRPAMGAALAVVACCFCVGAGALLNSYRGGGKGGDYDEQMEDLGDYEE